MPIIRPSTFKTLVVLLCVLAVLLGAFLREAAV